MPKRSRAAKIVRLVSFPEDEGELASQPMQALRAEIFIEVQRYLAVRTGAQAMARAFEWSLNSFVAVELAIDDDPDFVVFACNWLIAGLEVDDAEPRMTKGNSTIRADPMALTVRPAVMEALGGTLNEVCRDWITTREKRDDPAYMLSSPFGPGPQAVR